jgi:hypothetical protein
MARLDFRRGRHQDSIRWADRALALAEPLRLDETISMALTTKGTAMASSGQHREGMALLEGAAVDAAAHLETLPSLRALNNLASLTSTIDPRASLERTKLGMATARRLGLRAFDGYHAGNAATAAEPLGEWAWLHEAVSTMLDGGGRDRAEAEWLECLRDCFTAWTGDPDIGRAERLLAVARRDNDSQSEENLASLLARFAFAAGDPARALELTEPFIRGAPGGRSNAFEFVGRFALHLGNVEIARQVSETVGSGPGGAADHHLDVLHAGIAVLEGRRDDAVSLYRSALAGYRSFGLRFSIALTVFDMATLLGPEDPAVRSVMDEGRAILEELGARMLLDRLDALGDGGAAAAPGPGRQRRSVGATSVGADGT